MHTPDRELNEPDQKEKEFTECEYCQGDGWIYFDPDANSNDEDKCDCPKCNGTGQIEITD